MSLAMRDTILIASPILRKTNYKVAGNNLNEMDVVLTDIANIMNLDE